MQHPISIIMKNLKKVAGLVILFLTVLQLTATGQFDTPAEPPMEENVQSFGEPPAPEDTPIDGGLTLLLAAGAVYGVKKYRKEAREHEEKVCLQ